MMHAFRALSDSNSLIFWNPESVADIAYSDSRHSAFIGLVDCLSGMRKISDIRRVDPKLKLSTYNRQILRIAKRLAPIVEADEIISLVYDDVVEGPTRFAIEQPKRAKLHPMRKMFTIR